MGALHWEGGVVVHEADGDGQQPFVLHTPVERVLRVIGTIPGVNDDILVGRHLGANILVYHSLESGVSLVHYCPRGKGSLKIGVTDLPIKPVGLGTCSAIGFSSAGLDSTGCSVS